MHSKAAAKTPLARLDPSPRQLAPGLHVRRCRPAHRAADIPLRVDHRRGRDKAHPHAAAGSGRRAAPRQDSGNARRRDGRMAQDPRRRGEHTRKGYETTFAATSGRRLETYQSSRSRPKCWRTSTPSYAVVGYVRCDGALRVDHRMEHPHECRVVRHPSPAPGTALLRATAHRPVVWSPSVHRTGASHCPRP
jgi:hypothetical protein